MYMCVCVCHARAITGAFRADTGWWRMAAMTTDSNSKKLSYEYPQDRVKKKEKKKLRMDRRFCMYQIVFMCTSIDAMLRTSFCSAVRAPSTRWTKYAVCNSCPVHPQAPIKGGWLFSTRLFSPLVQHRTSPAQVQRPIKSIS